VRVTGVRPALSDLNARDRAGFIKVCGPILESSPWIAAHTWPRRPFPSIVFLHRELVATVDAAADGEKIALIAAHPDLVGRMAREGALSPHSSREQEAAGLTALSAQEIARFEMYNRDYRVKFGFPFVICARENRKEAILAAFPKRLAHSREQEVAAALAEIAKIARLRLRDAVTEA
jgi:2-oxo-4-hydroxy-4-carboxy-5-ureidoimidazoline decarboxylase